MTFGKRFIAAATLMVFFSFLGLTSYLVYLQREQNRYIAQERITNQANLMRISIESEFNRAVNITRGLSVFIATHPDFTPEEFNQMAEGILGDIESISHFALARQFTIEQVYPLAGNEPALGLNYRESPDQWREITLMLETGETQIAGPIQLVQGGIGFIGRVPIYTHCDRTSFWGLVSVIMPLEQFVEAVGLTKAHPTLNFALWKEGKARNHYIWGNPAIRKKAMAALPLNIPGGRWILGAAVNTGQEFSRGLWLSHISGLAVTVIITLLFHALLNAYRKTNHYALHDVLTGLANRRLLNVMMQQYLGAAQRKKRKLGVLYLDLDNFKPVNDNHGHKNGDKVLIALAERLQSHMRSSDLVARLGGDEFVIILPDIDETAEVFQAAGKVHDLLAAPFPVEETQAILSASIGISLFPDHAAEGEQLLRCADRAMYNAKLTGKGRSVLYEKEL